MAFFTIKYSNDVLKNSVAISNVKQVLLDFRYIEFVLSYKIDPDLLARTHLVVPRAYV